MRCKLLRRHQGANDMLEELAALLTLHCLNSEACSSVIWSGATRLACDCARPSCAARGPLLKLLTYLYRGGLIKSQLNSRRSSLPHKPCCVSACTAIERDGALYTAPTQCSKTSSAHVCPLLRGAPCCSRAHLLDYRLSAGTMVSAVTDDAPPI